MNSSTFFMAVLMFVLLGISKINAESLKPPTYEKQNLISNEEEKFAIVKAIRMSLRQQGLDKKCPGPYKSIDYRLEDSTFIKSLFELYKFENISPLFIISTYSSLDKSKLFDYKVYTNFEKTGVEKVEAISYRRIWKEINIGTLDSPVFESREFLITHENDCSSQVE